MQFLLRIITVFLAFLAIYISSKLHRKSSPAFLFTFVWSVQIVVLVIGWSNMLLFNYQGLLYIILCLLFFNIGCLFVSKKTYANNRIAVINYNRISKIFSIVLSVSILNTIATFYQNGLSFNSFLNIETIAGVANELSVERYSGESTGGAMERLLGVCDFITAVLGGYMFYLFPQNRRYLSVCSILPLVIGGLVHGAKMGTITGCALWFSGYIISSETFGFKIGVNFKLILIIISSFVVFFSLMLLNMMMRIGHVDLETFSIVTEKMTSYALGHLPAFDIWFVKADIHFSELTFGGKTFYGITNALGILKREQGLFTDMCQISTNGSATNVYTVFRVFIEDFGTLGTPIYLMIMGLLTTTIYNRFMMKKYLVANTSFFCTICFFICLSFCTSIFVYTSYIVLSISIYAIFKLSGLRTMKK